MNLLRGSSLTPATDCPTRPALGHLGEGLTFSQAGPEKPFHLHWGWWGEKPGGRHHLNPCHSLCLERTPSFLSLKGKK